jgi:hypothetical protein
MRFLHVANGGCTTEIIRAAGIPGVRSLWADPLYEGPVPGGLTDEELLDVRARFLAGPSDASDVDDDNSLRTWRANIDRHESYDELILWFEHDLFDQLSLIQVLTWIRARLPAAKTVSLICIGSFPGRVSFMGLGELTPTELASLLETRRAVSDAQYVVAARAWSAFRASDPEALDRLWRSDLGALPFLSAALRRFLEEYPWTRDGLSRSERRLLELAKQRPIDLTAAFPRMHEGEDAYYITDGSIVELVETFSRTSPALLIFDDAVANAGHVLHGTMAATDAGREVLAGRRDRIATCGIDRWYGGVHLEGRGPTWRWDDEEARIRRA